LTTSTPVVIKDPLKRRKGGDLGSHLPKHVLGNPARIPPYPYGPALLYKQSNSGLYGGQMIQFGNNVSPDTETKTRRHWKPNVLNKNIYSIALKKMIRLRVTANVLKVIDREGGLDEYLLKEDETRVKELGPMGWALRWRIMQTPEVIAQFRAKAQALGLEQRVIDQNWPDPEMLKVQNAAILKRQEEQEKMGVMRQDTSEEERLAWRAAKRYLKRGTVDTLEDGLKLAFLRSEQRLELRAKQSDFLAKVKEMGGLHEYVKKQREELKKAGDLAILNPEKAAEKAAAKAAREAKIEELGGLEAVIAAARARAIQEIQEAEESDDEHAQEALKKAQWAIDIRDGVLRGDEAGVPQEQDSWAPLAKNVKASSITA
jgi:large subunit ribosomal protein L28